MGAQRNQRSQRKSCAGFFGETNQRRVMVMGQAGQAGLQRHGNIGGAEIEHDHAEAAGAQKLLAGARDASARVNAPPPAPPNPCRPERHRADRKNVPPRSPSPPARRAACASRIKVNVIVNAAEAAAPEISTNRPATSSSVHGVDGIAGRSFCAGDKAMNGHSGKTALAPERDTNDQISNRQQLQIGRIELLWEKNVAFVKCRKW